MANKGQMPTLQNLNQVAETHHMTEHHGNRMWYEQKHQEYTRTPHGTLAATSSVSWMLKPLPNILAITGGVSTRQKEGKGKTELRTCWNHGTPTHDRDTNAMLRSVRTCYFLPRIHVRKNSGAQWRTFYHFVSYKGAHTRPSRHQGKEQPAQGRLRCHPWLLIRLLSHIHYVDPYGSNPHGNTHQTKPDGLRQEEGKTSYGHTRPVAFGRM